MSPVTPSTKPCILLVDDDPDIGRALTDLLEHEQYQVMAVGTGTEAIAQARVRRFSAVILDLGLPDLDGLAVLKVLRDLDPNLPILVLTALTSEGRKASSVAAGAYGFLSKPYDKAELKETLLRAVAGNSLATKVQQVEQALACSDHREQQALLDSISEMFWYKDGDNRIIRTNASAAWSIGRNPLEVEGQSTYDLYPEEAEKYHQDDLEVITSGRTKRGIVEWYQAGSGEKRWVQTDKVPYRDAQGNIIGVLVFARDITDRMKTEEQSDAVPHKQDRRRPLASPAPHCSAHPSCTTSTCLR
jgi:PAS domain S-box-containing protein